MELAQPLRSIAQTLRGQVLHNTASVGKKASLPVGTLDAYEQ
jgi:hypothetical protein